MNEAKLTRKLLTGLILIFFISSCKPKDKYHIGVFPDSPVNLKDFNSEFDDYNSNISVLGETFPFCFSSNRNSGGGDYDIVYKMMSISFSKKTGKLDIYEQLSTNSDIYAKNMNINSALSKINSSGNEFGPYLIRKNQVYNQPNVYEEYEKYIFLFSSNSSGNQDIKFTQNFEIQSYDKPMDITFLNSVYDDAYPTFNKDFSQIYFTSNRESDFNIYSASIDKKQDLLNFLLNTKEVPIAKVNILSSEYDDKCPYISND